MSGAIIKRFPDTSGCEHKQTSRPRVVQGFEFVQCFDCNFAIAFHLDEWGNRIGRGEIVQIEEVFDPPSPA